MGALIFCTFFTEQVDKLGDCFDCRFTSYVERIVSTSFSQGDVCRGGDGSCIEGAGDEILEAGVLAVLLAFLNDNLGVVVAYTFEHGQTESEVASMVQTDVCFGKIDVGGVELNPMLFGILYELLRFFPTGRTKLDFACNGGGVKFCGIMCFEVKREVRHD